MSDLEQTLSIIKPDAVERDLQNKIKEEFIKSGFTVIKEKKIHITKTEAEEFYKVHQTKPFYNDLCEYLSSGPILVMIFLFIFNIMLLYMFILWGDLLYNIY